MEKFKCVNCGYENKKDVDSNEEFRPVWNISNGLDDIILCKNCYDIVKQHVESIEKVIKTDIELFKFVRYDR